MDERRNEEKGIAREGDIGGRGGTKRTKQTFLSGQDRFNLLVTAANPHTR